MERQCLVLAPGSPFPARDAVAIRIVEFLRLLGCRVDLLVFGDEDRETDLPGPVPGRLIEVQRPPRIPRSRLSQFLFGDPTTLASFRSERYAEKVTECLAAEPALVLAVGLQMGQYLDLVPASIPTVLDDYNVEWRILDRLASLRTGPKRVYWWREAQKLRNWEASLLRKPKIALAISDVDRVGLQELAPDQDIRVVGPCIPVEPQSADSQPRDVEPVLVFTGAFNWHVNVQAAEWFCRSVFADLRAQVPGVAVKLVGKDPAPPVLELAKQPGVVVTGTVPDVQPFLREAAVAIVPLQYGSGVRYKILEAFSAGVPVVTTSIGCEGLSVRHGEHLLIADEPQAFSAACVSLLRDRVLRQRLVRQAAEWLEETNQATARAFQAVVRSCVGPEPGEPAAKPGGIVPVILTYNQRALTLSCLRHLEACRNELAGVVLVDNASSDDTLRAVQHEFPWVEVVRSEENLGVAGGRNLGIRRALELGAEYIWTVDNDTQIPAGTATRLADYLDTNPQVGIAAATVCWGDEPEKVWSTVGRIDWGLGEPQHPERNGLYRDLREEFGDAAFISGCNMFIRAELVREIGPFDERFFYCYEDVDLSLRARRKGYRLVSMRDAVIYHFHKSALGPASPRLVYFTMRNRFLFMEQNATPAQRLMFNLRWYSQFCLKFLPKRLLLGDRATLRAAWCGVRDYWTRNWQTQPKLS